MYEYLKALFGTGEDGQPEALTFEQLVAKIEAADDLKLANLADGGYVSKAKFDAKDDELKGIRDQLTAANTTIQSYKQKDMDIEKVRKSAEDWEAKYQQETAALQEKVAQGETKVAALQYLGQFHFRDDLAREAVIQKFLAKGLTREGDTFLGADDFMKALKEQYPASFEEAPAPAAPASDPAPAPAPAPHFAPNQPPEPPQKRRTLSEMMKYKNEHPDAKITFGG